MRYGVSRRASSVIAALLAVLLTLAMQLLSTYGSSTEREDFAESRTRAAAAS